MSSELKLEVSGIEIEQYLSFAHKTELKQINSESGPIQISPTVTATSQTESREIELVVDILTSEKQKIHLDNLLDAHSLQWINSNYDYIVAASRHKSEAGKPALLVHCPGNYGTAEAGGQPKSLAKSSAILQFLLFRGLKLFKEKHLFDFPIDLEVTHHGPTELTPPIAFIELGSSDNEYNNPTGGLIIAKSIILAALTLATEPKASSFGLIVCLGFGGMHYAGNFSKKFDEGFAFSHIVSKYHIAEINKQMIEKMIEKSLEPPQLFVIDWKSLKSEEKHDLTTILKELNLPIARSSNL